jgi:hypothetical protein
MHIFESLKILFSRIPEGHKRFRGRYHGGWANYIYVPDGDKRIFDGPFSYYESHRQEQGHSRYRIKGFYEQDRKTGLWIYKHKAPTQETTLTLNYDHGHYSGRLVFDDNRFGLNEVVTSTHFEFDLDRRHPQGEITCFVDGSYLHGAFDDHGLPHGEWQLAPMEKDDVQKVEREEWSHGHFLGATTQRNEKASVTEGRKRLREMINMYLDNDCARMLQMAGRGDMDEVIHIGRVIEK